MNVAQSSRSDHAARRRVAVSSIFSALAIGLSACASNDALELREHPDFARGIGPGCATAREEDKSFSTKRYADEYSFENSRAYRAGWRQGYLECQALSPDRNNGGRILGNENRF